MACEVACMAWVVACERDLRSKRHLPHSQRSHRRLDISPSGFGRPAGQRCIPRWRNRRHVLRCDQSGCHGRHLGPDIHSGCGQADVCNGTGEGPPVDDVVCEGAMGCNGALIGNEDCCRIQGSLQGQFQQGRQIKRGWTKVGEKFIKIS